MERGIGWMAQLKKGGDGTKEWRVNGQLHRLDGPAVIKANGDKMWFFEDKLHRLDGPAVELRDGTKEWWKHGVQEGLN